MRLAVRSVLDDGRQKIALAGERFVVVGRVRHPRAGERVVVRFFHAGTELRRRRIAVTPAARKGEGRFELRFSTPTRGRLRIVASRAPETARGRTSLRLLVAGPQLGPRSAGPLVAGLQRRLAGLRYSVRPTGVYDRATGFAVLAFRGVNRLPASDRADARVLSMLARGRGRFGPRFPRHGRHVEADLSRRALALLDGQRVVRVLHTSPGRRVTPTVLGSYRFYRRQFGRNSSGMLHSTYFHRGYAVHGYSFVPQFPDSHGCLRIPNADALFVYRWIRIGDPIDVYR